LSELKALRHRINQLSDAMHAEDIRGQCLQLHRDPATQEETVVFSCFNQDQLLYCVNSSVLRARLSQNSTQEKFTGNSIDYCLR
jgi:hypothetical protein